VTAPSDASGKPAEGGRSGGGPGPGRRPAEPDRGDPERPAYEQARDELAELVRRLEAGGLTLEQSLRLWERGEQLAAICEEWLEGARARLATAMARQQHQEPAPGAPF
jgi:exodeoxyribonuclease VII small subunit